MGESEGEIEYLDEDEDIVNQCVQFANKSYLLAVKTEKPTPEPTPRNEYQRTLANSSNRGRKRRRNSVYEEADSDYDPTDDIRIAKGIKTSAKPQKQRPKTSVHGPSSTSKHHEVRKKTKSKKVESTPERDEPSKIQQQSEEKEEMIEETIAEMMAKRRDMEITIPDYDDPLCLPVRVLTKQRNDVERVKKWNELCLRYYQRYTNLQRNIVKSTRELSFMSKKNHFTDTLETTVAGKVICKDRYRHTKVEEYRGLLPNYREVKVLKFAVDQADNDDISVDKKIVSTVILTKECQNSDDCLSVYKSEDAIAAVYTCVTDKINKDDPTDKEVRRTLKEKVVIRMCPMCYQLANRPAGDVNEDKPMECAVCHRKFTSAYNLIRHVKTHANKDVMPKRKEISATLSALMNYHYNCRICNETCSTIEDLRRHVKEHKVSEAFDCEVCSQHVMAG